jgi:hypothetical protein
LPGAVQRLVDVLDERERDAGEFLDLAINRAVGAIRNQQGDQDVEEPDHARQAMFPQLNMAENRLQPGGLRDQEPDALPRRIPFIFQPIRHILEPSSDANASNEVTTERDQNMNVDNAENEAVRDEGDHEMNETNPEDQNTNATNGNEQSVRPRPLLFHRARARIRRSSRLRLTTNHNVEDEVEGGADQNDDFVLRTMFEARERELDELQERLIETKYFGSIRFALLQDVEVPQNGLGVTKKPISSNTARLKDSQNRLPLHYSIEKGYFSEGFQEILAANPEAVSEVDGKTNLYPFALACAYSQHLDIIFDLLLRNPSVMDYILPLSNS